MFSRNFGFVRFVRSGLLFKYFSLEIIFVRQSCGIYWSTSDRLRCAQNLNVGSFRTSSRNMSKKAKVTRGSRGTQQSHDPDPLKQGDGNKSAISLNKDGQICIRIVAKPGAKHSNLTGEARTRPPRLPT